MQLSKSILLPMKSAIVAMPKTTQTMEYEYLKTKQQKTQSEFQWIEIGK